MQDNPIHEDTIEWEGTYEMDYIVWEDQPKLIEAEVLGKIPFIDISFWIQFNPQGGENDWEYWVEYSFDRRVADDDVLTNGKLPDYEALKKFVSYLRERPWQ